MSGRVKLPGWLAPVLVGLATLVLFRDFVFSDRMLLGSDTLNLGYMARAFYADHLREGVFPHWNPIILGGTPVLESLAAGDALYPTSLLLLIVEPYRALGWKLVFHVFLAGLFMYGWTRALGRSRAAATVSALAYTVAPFFVTFVRPGHDGKLFVTALTPLLFWAMEWTFVRRGLLPYVAVAFVVALVILTTHFQLAYFLFGAAGLYYLFRVVLLWRTEAEEGEGEEASEPAGPGPRPAARFGLFLAFSVLGALAAGVQLVPAFDYVTEFSRRIATTTRATPEANRVYASSWSLHPEEVASLVIPEFPGNNAGDAEWTEGTYWGRNATRDNHQYAGLVVLLLAAVSFVGGSRRGVRWFLAGLGAVALLYGLGTHTPVWGLFYALVPGVDLFRAPDSVAFLFGFAAVTLAAFGVDRLQAMTDGEAADRRDETVLVVLVALAGALFIAFLFAASGGLTALWTSTVNSEIGSFREALLREYQPFIVRGAFVGALLGATVTGLAWAAHKKMLGRSAVVAVLVLLVFGDGFRVSEPFVQTLDFEAWSRPDPIVERLLRLQESEPPFRVASADQRFQSVRPGMFGLELATGHHPNDLARYRELIGMAGSGEPQLLFAPNVRSILNLRYLIVPGQLEGGTPLLQTRLSNGEIAESLYELPTLARARLVADAVVVPDEEAVETILSPTFDPTTTAVLAESPPIDLGGGAVEGAVEWIERDVNRQVLRVSTDRPALLVVADNWFPAWKATVDGEETTVMRAYHTLRAVPVGPGEHEVVFRYESGLIRASLGLSLVTVLLLAGIGAFDLIRSRRGRSDA